MKWCFLVVILMVNFGCLSTTPPGEPTGTQTCPGGDDVELPSGVQVCVFQGELVIETGFVCPALRPHLLEYGDFAVCSPQTMLPRPDLEFLADIYGPGFVFEDPNNAPNNDNNPPPPANGELDLLWVIDNSGSMCRIQERVAEAFAGMIEELADVDFHIGITTTHMEDPFPIEPLARPGHLQSQPQALPGFDRRCWLAMDEDGELIEGDFSPLRAQLARAVSCLAETPPVGRYDYTDEEIDCVVNRPPDCEIPRLGCGPGNTCAMDDLFPDPSEYREIAKVLRASDYGHLNTPEDRQQLIDDFSCASLVGTRGFGIEKGLAAMIEAVSLELTGGPADGQVVDPDAANHGFIRQDSRFGAIIISDEDDCSDDGAIDSTSMCGDHVCLFQDEDLTPVEELRDRLLSNLQSSKNRTLTVDEVFVAGFHGPDALYSGRIYTSLECNHFEYHHQWRESCPEPAENCEDPGPPLCNDPEDCEVGNCVDGLCRVDTFVYLEQESCVSEMGNPFPAGRYFNFLSLWNHRFPTASEGLLCEDALTTPFGQLGQSLGQFATSQ